MPNRYKTPGEIAGAKRRTQDYQAKLRKAGLTPRQHWVTDGENAQIKRVIKRWRGEATDLTDAEAEAADALKPCSETDRFQETSVRTLVKLDDYPELKLIAWHVNAPQIDEEAAFAIYERNWRYIDHERLSDCEKALIEKLAERFGRGVMNV